MFAKKQKTKATHFSSEDSQNTDHSMDSSFEIEETNAKNNQANKFNQLRETMNQLFLANPELAEEIKFEQYLAADEKEQESPTNLNGPHSPFKKGLHLGGDALGIEEPSTNISSSKLWGAISKEMTKPQKNSKMPSLNQINHILNIFKTKFEKIEHNETSFSPTKTALKKPKSEFRIHSAKGTAEKQSTSRQQKDGKGQNNITSPQNTQNSQEEEDGVNYYSFRKKLHLKLKQKRRERELEEQKKKREEEAQKERMDKEREQKLKMYTLAELDRIQNVKVEVDDHGEASARNTAKFPKPRIPSRKNSLKPKGDIFERLTKDMNKNSTTEDEEPHTKRTFNYPFAENLYKDMKAFGDPEAFKKIAQTRIMNYKKEFKEKLAKQKQLPLEGMKFSKEKSRGLNMFLPDFEKTMAIANKDMIFNQKEAQKENEDWKENPDYDILIKFQKNS